MKSWTVTARGLASVRVEGINWVVALGHGLQELGRAADLSRLACEVLPNGTVIARDIGSGTGYVVQGEEEDGTLLETFGIPEAAEPAFTPDARDRREGPVPLEEEDEPLGEVPTPSLDESREEEGEDPALPAIDAAETDRRACELAVKAAVDRVGAESGAVILGEGGYLRFAAVHGPSSTKLEGVRLPAGTGVAGYVVGSRRSVVLSDAQEDPRHFGELDARTGYLTRQMAVVPVQEGERVLGVIEVMNRDEAQGGRFDDTDVVAVEEVAAALARRLLR